MKFVYPDYYEKFRCTAEKCRHNCCIGWEIDIDSESLEFYKSVKGDFGERLRQNISLEGIPHFILKENERCPFLNDNNLCDIYTSLGENNLCQICSDHPRFYNELEGRTEAGLGLCCEEAARLIITQKEPVKLLGDENVNDGLFVTRKKIFELLQDRSKPIPQRVEDMLKIFNHPVFENTNLCTADLNISEWLPVFESLERLDESWSVLLAELKENLHSADTSGFDNLMKGREHEYEQFLCYLIYRHLSKAEFAEEMAVCLLFAALSYRLIYALGAVIFTKRGEFTTENQLELIRLFSSEIEYSDENLDIIFNEIDKEIFDC